MRALRLTAFGKVEGLTVEEIARPTAGAGEVLVKVKAASVNPSDVKNVQGFMHQTSLPRTPGRDFAGTVAEGKKELMGAEVWGTGDLGFVRDGTHAEFLLLPESGVVRRPGKLSAEQAACCGVTFVTAAYGLREAGVKAGIFVVVIGIFGGVGRAVAQIAKMQGAIVIGVARSDAPSGLPNSFEGMTFVNSSKEDAGAAIKRLTGGKGADIVYDTVGGAMVLEALKYLGKRGRIIEISPGHDPMVTLNLRDFYHQEARLLGIDSLSLDTAGCAEILGGLVAGFESGALNPPPIAGKYGLDEAVQAYQAVEKGGEGRHVLVME